MGDLVKVFGIVVLAVSPLILLWIFLGWLGAPAWAIAMFLIWQSIQAKK